MLLIGRDEGRLNEQVAKVFTLEGRAVAAIVDLQACEAAAGRADRAVKEFGSLHGIVHTASLFAPQPLEEMSIECFDLQWKTNVLAPIMMTKRAVPYLAQGSSIRMAGGNDRSETS